MQIFGSCEAGVSRSRGLEPGAQPAEENLLTLPSCPGATEAGARPCPLSREEEGFPRAVQVDRRGRGRETPRGVVRQTAVAGVSWKLQCLCVPVRSWDSPSGSESPGAWGAGEGLGVGCGEALRELAGPPSRQSATEAPSPASGGWWTAARGGGHALPEGPVRVPLHSVLDTVFQDADLPLEDVQTGEQTSSVHPACSRMQKPGPRASLANVDGAQVPALLLCGH